MPDIDGQEAFEHVVDRLIEEGRARTFDMEARKEAEARCKQAEAQLSAARSEATKFKNQLALYANAESSLVELYDEIDKAVLHISNVDVANALRAARDAVKKFIDPIPF